jgi:hypothetical protein
VTFRGKAELNIKRGKWYLPFRRGVLMIFKEIALCLSVLLFMGVPALAQGGAFSQASASASSGFFVPTDQYNASEFEINTSYQSSVSYYSEFYSSIETPVVGGIVSTPSSVSLIGKTPASVYLAPGMVVSYAQYSSSIASLKSNELWISGQTDWSRYVACPVGTWLQLLAYSPAAGAADVYEIVGNQLQHRQYQFSSGYNSMSYQADQAGRHVLLFVSGNQSSNAIIVDVLAASSPSQPSSQTTSQPYTITPVPTPVTTSGDTPVTIVSQGMRGYQVYLDGNYIGKEGTGGDVLDGKFSFTVVGDQNHNVRVYDGQFNYPKTIYFQKGVQKIINVEPGTAVYV